MQISKRIHLAPEEAACADVIREAFKRIAEDLTRELKNIRMTLPSRSCTKI
jgi:hypothetical protein